MRRIIGVFTCLAALTLGSAVFADNQQLADNIEQALVQRANLQEADQIQVSVKSGVVTLEGVAANASQRVKIEKVVKSVSGVKSVNNMMRASNQNIQQVSASIMEPAAPAVQPQKKSGFRAAPVSYGAQAAQARPNGAYGQDAVTILSDEAVPPQGEAMPTPAPVQYQQQPQQYTSAPAPVQYQQQYTGAPVPMASTPQYVMPDNYGQQHAVRYDKPYLPKCAWPSYAAYPNYAQVTYPKRYSANAWPYIGPVYPYPQVPLGWREVSLKWHDGSWRMEYNDGTFHGASESIFRPFRQNY